MKILVISGSIRSRQSHLRRIGRLARDCRDITDLAQLVADQQWDGGRICNSDVLAGAVHAAIVQVGVEASLFSLTKLFLRHEGRVTADDEGTIDPELVRMDTLSLDETLLTRMKQQVAEADGIVFVTPVYFGDRSSVANKFLQLSGIHDMLHGKVFGAVAVGAKRNGGQETAVIYSLLEALAQRALIVGNGPPTSQYGGTAIGGHRGTVASDEWGLRTAAGTGQRVAHVCNLVAQGAASPARRPVKILVLVTMDDDHGMLHAFLKDYLRRAESRVEDCTFELVNILDSTIYRCLGCDACPPDGPVDADQPATVEHRAHCVIRHPADAMDGIHARLLDADAVILAGLNVKQYANLVYRYQVLIERTRFIRRDHFELTDKLFTALSLNQIGARINSLHTLKVVTSYIRHNTIMHRSIEVFLHDGQILDDGMDDLLSFVRHAQTLARGREVIPRPDTRYLTNGIGGYGSPVHASAGDKEEPRS